MVKNIIKAFSTIIIVLTSCTQFYGMTTESPGGILRGRVPASMNGDTLTLEVFDYDINAQQPQKYFRKRVYTTVVKEDVFRFEVPFIAKIHYFNLTSTLSKPVWVNWGVFNNEEFVESSGTQNLPVLSIEKGMMEGGDDIEIIMQGNSLHFEGKGSAKLEMLFEAKNSPQRPQNFSIVAGSFLGTKMAIEKYKQISNFEIGILKKYKDKISPLSYQILYVDILAKADLSMLGIGSFFQMIDTVKRNRMLWLFEQELKNRPFLDMAGISQDALGLSREYAPYIYTFHQAGLKYKYWKTPPPEQERIKKHAKRNPVFDRFCTEYKGLLRDKILMMFINRQMQSISQEMLEEYLNESLALVETNYFKGNLLQMVANFAKGKPVIDFEYVDREGDKVRLSDFRGKVVFVDLWFTGCGACKKVASAMPEVTSAFKGNKNVEFLSISIDTDRKTWLTSIDTSSKKSYTYKFAGDYYSGEDTKYLYTGGKGSEDPFVQQYVLSGYPTLLLIDKSGNLFSFHPTVPGNGRSAFLIDEINEALKMKN